MTRNEYIVLIKDHSFQEGEITALKSINAVIGERIRSKMSIHPALLSEEEIYNEQDAFEEEQLAELLVEEEKRERAEEFQRTFAEEKLTNLRKEIKRQSQASYEEKKSAQLIMMTNERLAAEKIEALEKRVEYLDNRISRIDKDDCQPNDEYRER